MVPRQNSDEGRQQQQKHSLQLQKQLSSQIASRLSLNASAACVEDSSTSSPTTASSAAMASEEENQFYDVCSDSDVTSYSDVIKGDKSHGGDSISHSRYLVLRGQSVCWVVLGADGGDVKFKVEWW